jgi:hypothetical protein
LFCRKNSSPPRYNPARNPYTRDYTPFNSKTVTNSAILPSLNFRMISGRKSTDMHSKSRKDAYTIIANGIIALKGAVSTTIVE